jgi:hypothetical protein
VLFERSTLTAVPRHHPGAGCRAGGERLIHIILAVQKEAYHRQCYFMIFAASYLLPLSLVAVVFSNQLFRIWRMLEPSP